MLKSLRQYVTLVADFSGPLLFSPVMCEGHWNKRMCSLLGTFGRKQRREEKELMKRELWRGESSDLELSLNKWGGASWLPGRHLGRDRTVWLVRSRWTVTPGPSLCLPVLSSASISSLLKPKHGSSQNKRAGTSAASLSSCHPARDGFGSSSSRCRRHHLSDVSWQKRRSATTSSMFNHMSRDRRQEVSSHYLLTLLWCLVLSVPFFFHNQRAKFWQHQSHFHLLISHNQAGVVSKHSCVTVFISMCCMLERVPVQLSFLLPGSVCPVPSLTESQQPAFTWKNNHEI